MAAAPTSPHSDSDQHDLLAHAFLNDPNFDVDAELRRRSSGSQRRRAVQSTALNTHLSIRRRPSVGPGPGSTLSPPPSSSSPRSGFPLIPLHLPTPTSLSRQPSYEHEPQLHPVQNFAANPQPAPSIPSVSLPLSSFISHPNPLFNGPNPNPNHGHTTAVEDEYCDMESIAPSTSPHHFSTHTYRYDKKHASNDDYAMEMDIEEYAFFSPSTSKRSSTRWSILPHLSHRVLARPISLTPISHVVT
jgi:hypothetical protein